MVDISDREQVYAAAERLKAEFGGVDILVNNAGIVACKTFWELSDRMIENTYAVNILAHYWVRNMILYIFLITTIYIVWTAT